MLIKGVNEMAVHLVFAPPGDIVSASPDLLDSEGNFGGDVVRYEVYGGTIRQVKRNDETGVEMYCWSITVEPWMAAQLADHFNDLIKERDRWKRLTERALTVGEAAAEVSETVIAINKGLLSNAVNTHVEE